MPLKAILQEGDENFCGSFLTGHAMYEVRVHAAQDNILALVLFDMTSNELGKPTV